MGWVRSIGGGKSDKSNMNMLVNIVRIYYIGNDDNMYCKNNILVEWMDRIHIMKINWLHLSFFKSFMGMEFILFPPPIDPIHPSSNLLWVWNLFFFLHRLTSPIPSIHPSFFKSFMNMEFILFPTWVSKVKIFSHYI